MPDLRHWDGKLDGKSKEANEDTKTRNRTQTEKAGHRDRCMSGPTIHFFALVVSALANHFKEAFGQPIMAKIITQYQFYEKAIAESTTPSDVRASRRQDRVQALSRIFE
jgi:hypothetical protein